MTRTIIALKQSYIAPHPVPFITNKKIFVAAFAGGLLQRKFLAIQSTPSLLYYKYYKLFNFFYWSKIFKFDHLIL